MENGLKITMKSPFPYLLLVADGAIRRDSSKRGLVPAKPPHHAATGIAIEEKAMKTIALIAAGLLAGSGFAHAEDATTVLGASAIVEHVPYQPSELASESGIHGLRMRIFRAAVRVCETPETFPGPLSGKFCVVPVLSDAYAQVDRAVARSRNGEQANAGGISVRVR
jgi:UrcA family protein